MTATDPKERLPPHPPVHEDEWIPTTAQAQANLEAIMRSLPPYSDPAKDTQDSYYVALVMNQLRTIETQAARIKELERADSEYESLCDDLKAAEARVAEFRAALAEILALDSTRSIWDARGIARSALIHGLMMRHLDIRT